MSLRGDEIRERLAAAHVEGVDAMRARYRAMGRSEEPYMLPARDRDAQREGSLVSMRALYEQVDHKYCDEDDDS